MQISFQRKIYFENSIKSQSKFAAFYFSTGEGLCLSIEQDKGTLIRKVDSKLY